MAKRKTAMVQPKPVMPAEPDRLEDILKELGNDRPYFIIEHHGDVWEVFFQGDDKPKTIHFKDGKWIMK